MSTRLLGLTKALSDVQRAGKELGTVARAEAVGRVSEAPKALHEAMVHRPEPLAELILEACGKSEAHLRSLLDGQATSQLRGEVMERAAARALTEFGDVEKRSVVRSEGSHTADFLVTLKRRLMGYEAGQTIAVEVKHGSSTYVLRELRSPGSHARCQLRETVRRHGADGALCMGPMEAQKCRALTEEVRASMAAEGQKLWLGLPREGAYMAGLAKARAALS